jgi:hypothetical protein
LPGSRIGQQQCAAEAGGVRRATGLPSPRTPR